MRRRRCDLRNIVVRFRQRLLIHQLAALFGHVLQHKTALVTHFWPVHGPNLVLIGPVVAQHDALSRAARTRTSEP